MTPLVMHYAPGVLAILKPEPCPGQLAFGGRSIMHSSCGCDRNHIIYNVVKVTVLQPGEEKWCLERSWIPRKVTV